MEEALRLDSFKAIIDYLRLFPVMVVKFIQQERAARSFIALTSWTDNTDFNSDVAFVALSTVNGLDSISHVYKILMRLVILGI